MKRRFAVLLTAVMTLTMGMSAFAAGSPGAVSKDVTSPTEGVEVTVPTEKVITDAKNEAAKVNEKADVLAVVEVSYEGATPAGGVSVTLNVAGVKKGDNIVLLHKRSSDGEWEQINPSSVEDGCIVATFGNGFSPVAIVKLPPKSTGTQEPPAGGTPTGNPPAGGTSTGTAVGSTATGKTAVATGISPKTGENM